MNIWLIQTGEQLPVKENVRKMRTALLADKLTERGHSVVWWASAFDHLRKSWVFDKDCDVELNENYKIKIIKAIGYKKNISLSRYIDYKIVARKFEKTIQGERRPDIIIASMPSYDLAYNAVMFARRNDIKILVDIRDQWPDIFLKYFPSSLRWFARLVLYKDFSKVKQVMTKADALIAMMDDLLEWGLAYAQREKTWRDRVFYLGCKKESDINNDSGRIQDLMIKIRNKFVVLFVGTFATFHNPSILIDCAARLVKSDIIFVLAGDGELFDQIKRKALSLPNVILTGWLNQKEIASLLKHSHAGVCPTPGRHDMMFLPNKAFMYFSASLPVLTAFDGPLRDILERHQAGFYYEPQDAETLVEKIKVLYKNKELYNRMSRNALKMFNDEFDADKIYEEYADHIERIAGDYYVKRKGVNEPC
jgi:glycosyltransferase involved in cell wall biosynthesis